MSEKIVDLTGLGVFKEQIKNKLGISYNETNKRIYIKFGTENIDFIDASAFLVDGMLDTVDIVDHDDKGNVGTFIMFVFNTGAGSKTIYLNADVILKDIPGRIDALEEAVPKKVDKVAGKGLSTCDFTEQYKGMLDNVATQADIIALFA